MDEKHERALVALEKRELFKELAALEHDAERCAHLFRMCRLLEKEARLIRGSDRCVNESRALMKRVDAQLSCLW